MFTPEQLQEIFPKARRSNIDLYCESINDAMTEFSIDTPRQQAMFIAQCGHESGQFSAVIENLNYGAKGLMGIFKKYFPNEALAKQYERRPEMIANRVYGGRMGNGPEATGDGFAYRGRGLIQLTGKDNYVLCGRDLEYDLVSDPTYLETPEGAARSAAWFWWSRKLNRYADEGNIKECTRRINGGYIGLEEREHFWHSAMDVLGE